ncbi:hypothetical protein B0H10DRAFT_2051975, partial [Mycena sp. CBHHK59/15]
LSSPPFLFLLLSSRPPFLLPIPCPPSFLARTIHAELTDAYSAPRRTPRMSRTQPAQCWMRSIRTTLDGSAVEGSGRSM